MVDPIGIKGATAVSRTAAATPIAASPLTPTAAVKPEPQAVQSSAAAMASEMASTPNVDGDRVARIRKAIQDGSFPLVPSTVADRLLALRMQWSGNDEA
jgi:negative regulator of flagellin synthesis FlgM